MLLSFLSQLRLLLLLSCTPQPTYLESLFGHYHSNENVQQERQWFLDWWVWQILCPLWPLHYSSISLLPPSHSPWPQPVLHISMCCRSSVPFFPFSPRNPILSLYNDLKFCNSRPDFFSHLWTCILTQPWRILTVRLTVKSEHSSCLFIALPPLSLREKHHHQPSGPNQNL